MYLVAIGWLYVALMMALAEAFHPEGSVLGAVVTFVLYGLVPVSLVMYVMGTPMRRRARLAAEQTQQQASASSAGTDAGTGTPQAPAAGLSSAADQPGPGPAVAHGTPPAG